VCTADRVHFSYAATHRRRPLGVTSGGLGPTLRRRVDHRQRTSAGGEGGFRLGPRPAFRAAKKIGRLRIGCSTFNDFNDYREIRLRVGNNWGRGAGAVLPCRHEHSQASGRGPDGGAPSGPRRSMARSPPSGGARGRAARHSPGDRRASPNRPMGSAALLGRARRARGHGVDVDGVGASKCSMGSAALLGRASRARGHGVDTLTALGLTRLLGFWSP
jgi:hypothetical protein